MIDSLSDAPVDLLEDVPAGYFEWTSKDQDNIDQAPEIQFSETLKFTSKKYTNEDVYTLISLVNRYPSGGHGGESFWHLMVKIYGDKLLEGRNGGGLRSRWRKVLKDNPNIEEYKKQLAASLSPEVIKTIERKISEGVAAISKYTLNNKAYTSLFSDTHKPKRKACKRKLSEDNKIYVDLNLIARKQIPILTSQYNSIENLIKLEHTKNMVIVKNTKEANYTIKDLTHWGRLGEVEGLCEKVDLERENIFKNTECEIVHWTELEDIVLHRPEYTEIYNQLIKLKGIQEVSKRKHLLGLS
jgi:hypothetical protein